MSRNRLDVAQWYPAVAHDRDKNNAGIICESGVFCLCIDSGVEINVDFSLFLSQTDPKL